MTRILAIARISLQEAMRSKVVLVLLLLLMAAVIGLPLTIKGDGTIQGQVQLMLSYSLTAVRIILALATLWAGCAAVSGEIEKKTIFLTATKPVHPVEQWLGKWLGLATLNVLLFTGAAAAVYLLLMHSTGEIKLTQEEQVVLRGEALTARKAYAPIPPVDSRQVEEVVQRQAQQAGVKAADMQQFREYIEREITQAAYRVQPGKKTWWIYQLKGHGYGGEAYLSYRFTTSELGSPSVSGTWQVLDGREHLIYEKKVVHTPNKEQSIRIPFPELVLPQDLKVVYISHEEDMTLFFSDNHGVHILVHHASFLNNYVRGGLMQLGTLLFIAGMAVSMGTLFHLPVAALSAGFLLLMTTLRGYILDTAENFSFTVMREGQTVLAPPFTMIMALTFKGSAALLRPLSPTDPVSLLSTGQLIEGALVTQAILVRVIVYNLLLLLLSAWILRRRELAR